MKYCSAKLRNRKRGEGEGGFILLLTVLITSVILAISLSIFSISLKEMVLASFIDNAARALVAADRGAECALYWDRVPTRANPQDGIFYTIFATSSAWTPDSNAMNNAICDGFVLTASSWSSPVGVRTADYAITSFSLTYADATCVDVTVSKDTGVTTVTANGYNSCSAANHRRTQRSIQVRYNL